MSGGKIIFQDAAGNTLPPEDNELYKQEETQAILQVLTKILEQQQITNMHLQAIWEKL